MEPVRRSRIPAEGRHPPRGIIRKKRDSGSGGSYVLDWGYAALPRIRLTGRWVNRELKRGARPHVLALWGRKRCLEHRGGTTLCVSKKASRSIGPCRRFSTTSPTWATTRNG